MRESSWSIRGYLKTGFVLAATMATYCVAKATGSDSWSLSRGEPGEYPESIAHTTMDEMMAFDEATSPWHPWTEQGEYVSYQDHLSTISLEQDIEFAQIKTDDVMTSVEGEDNDEDPVIELSTDEREKIPLPKQGTQSHARHLLMAPSVSDFRVNTYSLNRQKDARVSAFSENSFLITWESEGQDGSDYGIYAQQFTPNGTRIGGEFPVNSYTTDRQLNSYSGTFIDGDFVIAWASYGQIGNAYEIYAQRFTSSGMQSGNEFRVNNYTTGEQSGPRVGTFPDGRFVVVWHSEGQDSGSWGVYAKLYSANATVLVDEFRVNTYTAGSQWFPSISPFSNGDFVVAWRSDGQDGSGSGIYAQRYAAGAVAVGSEFRVNTYTTGDQADSRVGTFEDGSFIITWSSHLQDGDDYGVYAQRFAADGSTLGSEFRVNTYTINAQSSSRVGTFKDGSFVITWHSSGQDGSGYGIYAQRYQFDGTKFGSEFRVNPDIAGDQLYPSIATFSNRDFVISWQGNGQGGSDEIYARLFHALNIVNNRLVIHPGDSLILSPTDLQATNGDLDLQQIVFTVTNVTHGQFELITAPTVAITQFTQQQINHGEVRFVHDGSLTAPTYVVNVTDGDEILIRRGVAVLNVPTPDQMIEATQEYQYSLDTVFSGRYDVLDVTETDQVALPNWLTLEYKKAGQLNSTETYVVEISDQTLMVYGVVSSTARLFLFDITNKTTPILQSNYSTLYGASDIAASGQRIFLGGSVGTGTLEIVDFSNAANPIRLGAYVNQNGTPLTGSVNVCVQGNYAFLSLANNGLQIVNISNIASPQFLKGYATAGISATGIAIQGTKVYVSLVFGDYRGGMEIVDVSNPLIPFRSGIYDNGGTLKVKVENIFLHNNLAFLSCYNSGLVIVDVTNPATPVPAGWYDTSDYTVYTIVQENMAFISDNSAGLLVVDVKNPGAPRLIGRFNTPGATRQSAFKEGIVYVADGGSLQIIDVTKGIIKGTPTLSLVGQSISLNLKAKNTLMDDLSEDEFVLTVNTLPRRVETSLLDKSVFPGETLSVLMSASSIFFDESGDFLSLSFEAAPGLKSTAWLTLSLLPELIGGYQGDTILSIDVRKNLALTTNYITGFALMDVTDSTHPEVLSLRDTTGQTGSGLIDDDIAYIGDYGNALLIYNITLPSNPVLLSSVPLIVSQASQRMILRDNIIFAAAGFGGLKIVNVTSKVTPALIGNYTISTTGNSFIDSIALQDNIVAIGDAYTGNLYLFNITNLAQPQLLYSYHAAVAVSSVAIKNSILYVGDTWNACWSIVNISNPISPSILAPFCGANQPGFLLTYGNTLFSTAGSNGFQVLDINVLTQPKLIAKRSTNTNARSVAVENNKAYVSLNEGGFSIFDISKWEFKATPTVNEEGNYVIRMIATDRYSAQTEDSFVLRVEGSPRINGTLPQQYAKVGQAFNYFIPQGVFTDPNLDTLSFTARFINQTGLPAWLGFNGISAIFSGIPQSMDKGNFTILLTATDHIAGNVTTTMGLYVDHVPVVNQPIAQQIVNIDQPYQFIVPNTTFLELDDDGLDYSAQRSNGLSLPVWLSFQNSSRLLSGTPNATDAGLYDLAVTAIDTSLGAASAYFSLVVEYFPRVVANISAPLAGVDQFWTFTVSGETFADPDDSVLIYSASQTDDSALPSWLSFNTGSLTFSGVPVAVEPLSLRLRATDRWGAKAQQDFNVTITHFPVVTRTLDQQVLNISEMFIWMIPNDLFMEKDNETLSYQIKYADGRSLNGTDWLHFNTTSLILSGTPVLNQTIHYDLSVSASDPHGADSSVPLTLIVEHYPDLQKPLGTTVAGIDHSFTWTMATDSFIDLDQSDLFYSVAQADGSNLPGWITFNRNTMTLFSSRVQKPSSTLEPEIMLIRVNATDEWGISVSDILNMTIAYFPEVNQSISSFPLWKLRQESNFSLPSQTFFERGLNSTELRHNVTGSDQSSRPSWLEFNETTLMLSGTPPEVGSFSLKFVAEDSRGGKAETPFTLIVQPNLKPTVVQPISYQTATVGQSFKLIVSSLTFTDANGDSLSYSAQQADDSPLPGWLKFRIQNQSLEFFGTPGHGDTDAFTDHVISVRLQARDGSDSGSSAYTEFNIVVQGLSYWEIFIAVAGPLISLLTSGYAAYRNRAYFYNNCRKQYQYKELKESDSVEVGGTFNRKLGTEREVVHTVEALEPGEARTSCPRPIKDCIRFFKEPYQRLPGGRDLPVWMEYDETKNCLRSKGVVPTNSPAELRIQVKDDAGIIRERFNMRFIGTSQARTIPEQEGLLSSSPTATVHDQTALEMSEFR